MINYFLFLLLGPPPAYAMPEGLPHMTVVHRLSGEVALSASFINSSLPDLNNSLNGGSSGALTQAAENRSNAIVSLQNESNSMANSIYTQTADLHKRYRLQSDYQVPHLTDAAQVLQSAYKRVKVDLNSIADLPESVLPYRFESPPSERHEEVVGLFGELFKIHPTGYKRKTAQTFGLSATKAADHSLALNNDSDFRFYVRLGEEFLDMAVGIDPVSGFGRGSFELLTGRNMVTGQTLTVNERGMAFLCAATLGASHGPQVIATRMYYVFDGATRLVMERHALEAAVHEGTILFTRVEHLMTGSLQRFRIIAIKTAEEANKMFPSQWRDPFQSGSHVIEALTLQPMTRFVRLHRAETRVGSFVMRESAIKGMTVAEIRAKYAIPNSLTHISNVHIPSEVIIIRGNIQDHGAAIAGAVQYYLPVVQEAWFNNTRLFR